ncbi:hypothetical protein ACGFYV_36880, partial [Streptomyces sp. NPDC048297]|uniref:hypothetical protein n=1 Tax=Streptomyces sp. NPDC048297 TaxID=3365531 RepID=UPI0037175507
MSAAVAWSAQALRPLVAAPAMAAAAAGRGLSEGRLDVLPGLKSRDSGLGRLTLPGASCFTALCGHG